MCTAASYLTKDFYFGRTLDNEKAYEERIAVLPRDFPLTFRHPPTAERHYAIMGIAAGAALSGDYPLFYDGINERGLCVAGLNFVGNAVYRPHVAGKRNLAQFEFVPWLLCCCASVSEVRTALSEINLTDIPFSPHIPPAQLHWIIADKQDAIVVESVAEGLMVYDNPVGVLTNNPPFPQHMQNLNNYLNLTPHEPTNRFSDKLRLTPYSKGMGALGLPGDISSASRFVRAAFTKTNAISGTSEAESVGQFFHILGAVDNPRGCCVLGDGSYEITQYTCCYNADKGICYYTTYDNHQITAVDMHKVPLDGTAAVDFPFITEQRIFKQN